MSSPSTMHALAIGPRELLSGLSAFGVRVRHATTKDEALNILNEVRENQKEIPYAIVFIAETLTSSMSDAEYERVMGDDLPVVLTIPDLSSDEEAGLTKLRSLTKRAVGVDIFGGDA